MSLRASKCFSISSRTTLGGASARKCFRSSAAIVAVAAYDRATRGWCRERGVTAGWRRANRELQWGNLSLEVVPGPGSLRILREKVAILIENEGEREKRGLVFC